MLQNERQPNILDRLHQIMLKIIILSQIGADRYQKHIFEILLLSPPWSVVQCDIMQQISSVLVIWLEFCQNSRRQQNLWIILEEF